MTILEEYGRVLYNARENISLPEIQFAKTLAMPETKGGVLVLLQQPAPNQRYNGRDFTTIIQDCETLRAVDNVLRAVVGSSLEETSCFDAFPFQKVRIPTWSETGYFEYNEAYDVCKQMILEKQPDVVLCCYQSPDTTKFDLLYSLGVGKTRTYTVKLGTRSCIPVNAFHPSFAVNYNKSESCFRTLYMLETLQAFHKFNGTWRESGWMDQLRAFCINRAKDIVKGKSVTKNMDTILTFPLDNKRDPQSQDFQRWEQSFRDGLTGLMAYFDFMCSANAALLSDRELYNRMTCNNVSRLACDCLLVMKIVVENPKADDHFSHARDVRDVARSIRPLVHNFLLDTVEGPLQTVRKEVGLLDSSSIERLSWSLRFPREKCGLQYNLKTNLQTLLRNLSNSFIYESSKFYSTNLQLVEIVFSSFAAQHEDALEQHLVATTIRESEDASFITKLSSLKIDINRDNVSVQTRSVSSAIYRPRQFSPPQKPVLTAAPSFSQSNMPRLCFQCHQPGHFKDRCPQTQCYQCMY